MQRLTRSHTALEKAVADLRKAGDTHQGRVEKELRREQSRVEAYAVHRDAVGATLSDLKAGIDALARRLDGMMEEVRINRVMARQCIELAASNRTWHARLEELRSRLDVTATATHVRDAIDASRLELNPLPHVVVAGLLPLPVYDAVITYLPPSGFFDGLEGRAMKREVVLPMRYGPDATLLVWDLMYTITQQAVLPALLRKFEPALRAYARDAFPGGGTLDDRFVDRLTHLREARIFLRGPGYSIDPHRDPRWSFISCLTYLARPHDPEEFGTRLYSVDHDEFVPTDSVYYPDASQCRLVKTVPFRANTALAFMNSLGAHGADVPADADPATERYLYSVRFGPDRRTRARLEAVEPGRDAQDIPHAGPHEVNL